MHASPASKRSCAPVWAISVPKDTYIGRGPCIPCVACTSLLLGPSWYMWQGLFALYRALFSWLSNAADLAKLNMAIVEPMLQHLPIALHRSRSATLQHAEPDLQNL